jgi:hypothetical protein
MQSPAYMAMMGSAPAGGVPEIPKPQQGTAYPKKGGIGQNGFGIHPDTTPDQIVDYLLPKFQDVESKGDPTNYIGKSKNIPYGNRTKNTATGLYGYTHDTWGNYKGYPRAMDAPPEIQTEKMKADLALSLAKHGNDPFKVVANHYYPAYASNHMKWEAPIPHNSKDTPPMTVHQYVNKIFNAGSTPAGAKFAKYWQGVNPSGQSNNNQASLQLP